MGAPLSDVKGCCTASAPFANLLLIPNFAFLVSSAADCSAWLGFGFETSRSSKSTSDLHSTKNEAWRSDTRLPRV
jgi:hypothetical protein